MDQFGREQLRELIEHEQAPTISIYMPIERQELTKKATRLQFRGLVDEACELLEASETYESHEYQPLFDRLYALVDDSVFWNYQGRGLALFVAPEFERIYRLPMIFDPEVVVAPSFHTRPMLNYLLTPERYFVLAVGQEEVHFWRGTPAGLEPVDLGDMPTNMRDALQIQNVGGPQHAVDFHPSQRHNLGQEVRNKSGRGRGLPAPIFHGSGAGINENKAYIQEYCKIIDRGIAEYLRDNEELEGPVILAAVESLHSTYQSLSKLPNLAGEGIVGNVHYWNPSELHRAAWPIVRRVARQKIEDALEMWERSYGAGAGEMDLANVARRAIEGRVHLLMIEQERHVWGHFDRETGEIEILSEGGRDPASTAVDLLDEIAETVIMMGGRAVLVPPYQMPTSTGVAAVLRGTERPMTEGSMTAS